MSRRPSDVRGPVLIGSAVGDALGAPTEFMSLPEIRAKYGARGIREFEGFRGLPAGSWTDDTEMTIAVAWALIHSGHRGDDMEDAFGHEYARWYMTHDPRRSPGSTCRRAGQDLARGVPPRLAGVAGSTGCGAVMRVAPVGLFHLFSPTPGSLISAAKISAYPTHDSVEARMGAAVMAMLIEMAAQHWTAEEATRRVQENYGGTAVGQALRKAYDLRNEPDADAAYAQIGEGWDCTSAVAGAWFAFCRSPSSFEETVVSAATTQGDSDSLASMAGAISGAYNGLEAIPERWRNKVEGYNMLSYLSDRLLDRAAAFWDVDDTDYESLGEDL